MSSLKAQKAPIVITIPTAGNGARKDQKCYPLFDPTVEKVMMLKWEARNSQSTTFPSIIISEAEM